MKLTSIAMSSKFLGTVPETPKSHIHLVIPESKNNTKKYTATFAPHLLRIKMQKLGLTEENIPKIYHHLL